MARYAALLTLPAHHQALPDRIARTLEDCGLVMIYATSDYVMAKERPDQVSLAQLATIEVLINSTSQVELVVKNEQLPLQTNNHCRVMFETISGALLSGSSDGIYRSFS
ncbi:MAG: hypothetical protein VKL98_10390 [Cyanobacteriota bacterium]|nr:hypothetical protein [Cyanobacteriota bacterium]